MRELLVAFDSRDEFLAQQEQIRQGCILVPTPEPAPDALTEITVRLRTPTGAVETLRARVLQLLGATGVVLGLEDPDAVRRLGELLDEATAIEASPGATRVGWGSSAAAVPAEVPRPGPETFEEPPDAPEPPAEDPETPGGAPGESTAKEDSGPLADRIRGMSATEKMQLAAHGERAARLLLMKDPMRTVQTFLLQNPRITLEEIRTMAGSRQSLPDVLQSIAGHRDWSQNPGILTALVRNPRTPVPAAVRLLDRLPEQELRRLARSNDVPRGVQTAARKRLSGI